MANDHRQTDRVQIVGVETLSDNWYVLRKYRFRYTRFDGSVQEVSREAYDRGNGAVILLFNRIKKTLVLTRQFRLPAPKQRAEQPPPAPGRGLFRRHIVVYRIDLCHVLSDIPSEQF